MKKKQHIRKHEDLIKEYPLGASQLKDFSVFRMIQELEKEEEDVFYKNVFRSDFFTLLWVIAGTVDININLKTLHAKAGDVVIAAPNAPKQLVNISDDCIIEGVTFTSDFLVNLNIPQNHLEMMEFFTSKYTPLWSLSKEEQLMCSYIIATLTDKASQVSTHAYGKELLQHNFLTLFYEMAALSKKYATVNVISYNRKEELMINFVRLSSLHFKEHKNLSFYANNLFVSTKYLSETMKEVSGKTAGKILDELIIIEAKLLLTDGSLSISDIASQLNFSDRSFFGKFFKRYTGQSPKHYRETIW